MRRSILVCLVFVGCAPVSRTDAGAPTDAMAMADRTNPADTRPPLDMGPAHDVGDPGVDTIAPLDRMIAPDQSTPDVSTASDVAMDIPAASDVTPPRDVSTPVDTGVRTDGGLVAPTCEPVRLTYYDVTGAGACEVMDAPTALSDGARAGLTLAIAQPWSGGMLAGAPMAACGECWEVTTANAQRVLTVTDLCPTAGNPVCAGSFFHFDVARPAAVQLGYIAQGIVAASARRVPCPVTGGIRAVVRDQNPTFLRLTLANTRVAIGAVSFRGAGPGVSATNPWTAMRRDGGAWAFTGVGTLARGGTGVSLQVASAQGQVLDSTAVIPATATLRTVVDLGVQLDDLAPVGGTCTLRPPAQIYADGFGGIDRVRWAGNAWAGTTMVDAAYAMNCVSGTCLRFANVAQFSGFALFYPQSFARGAFTRVAFRARSNAARRLGVVLADGAARCTEQAAMVTTAWQRFEIDIAAACGPTALLRTIEMRNDGANGAEIVLDDVQFE